MLDPTLSVQQRNRPDISHLVIEDGKPVDNLLSEKQMRLLADCLSSSWNGNGRRFLTFMNVGLFYTVKGRHVVPDFMLAMDLAGEFNPKDKYTFTYCTWDRGKPPDLTIEIVSNKKGNEERKLSTYAKMGVPYTAIFDPLKKLGPTILRVWGLHNGKYIRMRATAPMDFGLSLCLWDGSYGDINTRWLRWKDENGILIPTGLERATHENNRAVQERDLATQERARATQECERADRAETEIRRLRALLETRDKNH